MRKLKRKLVSGKMTIGVPRVLKEIRWPHHYMSIVHDKQTQIIFSGSLNLILSEFPSDIAGSENKNKIKFLSTLADLRISMKWEEILNINSALFKSLEQLQVNWSCPLSRHGLRGQFRTFETRLAPTICQPTCHWWWPTSRNAELSYTAA
jgi:hypothetical protein